MEGIIEYASGIKVEKMMGIGLWSSTFKVHLCSVIGLDILYFLFIVILIMELSLEALSKSSDEEKEKVLWMLASKITTYKKEQRSPPKVLRAMSGFHPNDMHHKINTGQSRSRSKRHQTEGPLPMRKNSNRTPQNKLNLQLLDQRLLYQNLFNKISAQYSPGVIHSHVIIDAISLKQFWLDCCVCSQHVMNILMDPIKNKKIVDYETFVDCIGDLQSEKSSPNRIFFKKKQNIRIQKMLCN